MSIFKVDISETQKVDKCFFGLSAEENLLLLTFNNISNLFETQHWQWQYNANNNFHLMSIEMIRFRWWFRFRKDAVIVFGHINGMNTAVFYVPDAFRSKSFLLFMVIRWELVCSQRAKKMAIQK